MYMLQKNAQNSGQWSALAQELCICILQYRASNAGEIARSVKSAVSFSLGDNAVDNALPHPTVEKLTPEANTFF